MNNPNELDQQISNLRTLQQSYDQIAGAAEAYNTGKVQLAANITAKGIPASATETLPELAEKVGAIAQTQTILEGGEVMAAQQFGDGALWNLYQVLADMKTRFMGNGDYAALIVCEYYKGYDSLVLQGADGYYTCDGDYYDYASPAHVWHDADNGKINRWVAFLYRQAGARLDITNTAISPRSMYVGGHIGTIEYFVNGRLTDFVCGVEETDTINYLLLKDFTQAFNFNCVIKNVQNKLSGVTINSAGTLVLSMGSENITKNSLTCNSAQYLRLTGCNEVYLATSETSIKATSAKIIEADIKIYSGYYSSIFQISSACERIKLKDITTQRYSIGNFSSVDFWYGSSENLIDFMVGEMMTNLFIKIWNPTNVLADATKKAQLIDNIKNHILARVSDATGGTQLVFTISTNMYNEVASEQIEWQGEMMSLADAFLTKNWLLAGA